MAHAERHPAQDAMGLVPESDPDEDQKRRLEDFLTGLALLTRKYRIAVHDRTEDLELLDTTTGHLLGLGLARFTSGDQTVSYVPVDSILDGVWLV